MIAARSPQLSQALSFWVPGLGQFFAGEGRHGLLIFLASSVATRLARTAFSAGDLYACRWPGEPFAAAGLWAVVLAIWLWNIPDASRAGRRNPS